MSTLSHWRPAVGGLKPKQYSLIKRFAQGSYSASIIVADFCSWSLKLAPKSEHPQNMQLLDRFSIPRQLLVEFIHERDVSIAGPNVQRP
jgi:hypothetical protein